MRSIPWQWRSTACWWSLKKSQLWCPLQKSIDSAWETSCHYLHCFTDVKQKGRYFTEGRTCIRSSGFWIVGWKRLVASIIHKCVTCRNPRKVPEYQKISNVPKYHILSGQPSLSTVVVGVFVPWNIITRRTRGGTSNRKRWAALFTCLITKAVHIEVVEEMTS